jgi:hypothetical protein
VGVLKGRITATSLSLTLIDKQLGRKITFNGRRSGTEFVGKLTYSLRPASGSIRNFVVPDLFGF